MEQQTGTITLTNREKGDEEEETTSSEEETTSTENEKTPPNNKKNKKSKSGKTGDTTPILTWIIIGVAAAVVIIFLVVRRRNPGGVARTPDALALPVGTRAGTHGKGPDRLRGGDEYGPHGGTSPAERQKPGQGIPRQPGGRAAHHAHRHRQGHARDRRKGVLIWPSAR